MMAKIPGEIDKKDESKQILRVGIIAELDAVNLYEQLATKAKDKRIKKVLLDIAKEEKTHVGEFLSLLVELDKQQKEELEKGKKEVEELIG
jgi:rubrerythrin